MKKLFTTLLLVAAVALAGCESLGLKGVEMDSPESVERVKETIEKSIDEAQYKIVHARWYEREKLSNDMEYLLVEMVGTDGTEYSQTFKVAGDNRGAGELKPSRSSHRYDFGAIHTLSPADLDAVKITGWIEDAKSQIPEELAFRSVNNFTMHVDRITGKRSAYFTIYVVEAGNATSYEGGNIVTTYYEFEFDVQADGTVTMRE